MRHYRILVAMLLVSLAACAGPSPILKSNLQRDLYGKDAAERAVDVCRDKADESEVKHGTTRAGNMTSGAVLGGMAGAALGSLNGIWAGPGGIAIGAALGGGSGVVLGLLGGMYKPVQPSEVYTTFVERCLKEKGYEVSGWE